MACEMAALNGIKVGRANIVRGAVEDMFDALHGIRRGSGGGGACLA